jgi:hypothetical protein
LRNAVFADHCLFLLLLLLAALAGLAAASFGCSDITIAAAAAARRPESKSNSVPPTRAWRAGSQFRCGPRAAQPRSLPMMCSTVTNRMKPRLMTMTHTWQEEERFGGGGCQQTEERCAHSARSSSKRRAACARASPLPLSSTTINTHPTRHHNKHKHQKLTGGILKPGESSVWNGMNDWPKPRLPALRPAVGARVDGAKTKGVVERYVSCRFKAQIKQTAKLLVLPSLFPRFCLPHTWPPLAQAARRPTACCHRSTPAPGNRLAALADAAARHGFWCSVVVQSDLTDLCCLWRCVIKQRMI